MKKEDGFRFYELPALSGDAKSLIVILHGHNSHPDKYMKWAKKTQDENPDADVLLLCAPTALHASETEKKKRNLEGVDDLYTWVTHGHSWIKKDADNSLAEVFWRAASVEKLNNFIDAQLDKRGLKDKNLAIIGFSLGASVALQVGQSRPEECAAVVCHSGVMLPFNKKAAQKPDLLVIIGDKDELFYEPYKKDGKTASRLLTAFHAVGLNKGLHHSHSVERLQDAKVPFDEVIIKDQPHSITEESWKKASLFVAKRLKNKK